MEQMVLCKAAIFLEEVLKIVGYENVLEARRKANGVINKLQAAGIANYKELLDSQSKGNYVYFCNSTKLWKYAKNKKNISKNCSKKDTISLQDSRKLFCEEYTVSNVQNFGRMSVEGMKELRDLDEIRLMALHIAICNDCMNSLDLVL